MHALLFDEGVTAAIRRLVELDDVLGEGIQVGRGMVNAVLAKIAFEIVRFVAGGDTGLTSDAASGVVQEADGLRGRLFLFF